MPSPNRKTVKTYLTPEEYATVVGRADRASLSVSSFIKMASLAQEIKPVEHQEFRLELLRLVGDLGRLGGLLKMSLASEQNYLESETRSLLKEIEARQKELKALVTRI